MELGDSDNLTVGEWVMSIGSPFGLEQSVATGIVSATNRSQIMDNSSDSYQYGQQQSGIQCGSIGFQKTGIPGCLGLPIVVQMQIIAPVLSGHMINCPI